MASSEIPNRLFLTGVWAGGSSTLKSRWRLFCGLSKVKEMSEGFESALGELKRERFVGFPLGEDLFLYGVLPFREDKCLLSEENNADD